jgi:hypothetical protein
MALYAASRRRGGNHRRRPGTCFARFGVIDRSVGRTLEPKRYPVDSALSAPHAPDRASYVASRRDILLKRRPRGTNRLPDFVNCVLLLTVQVDGHGTLLLAKVLSPAAFPAACSRGCQPRVRPFADEITFKLRERSKDMKHQLAAGCRRIDGFGDALESDQIGLQLSHQLDQVLEGPPQPVEPPDRQQVSRSKRIVHTL